MSFKVLTKNSPRWDAVAKVRGEAEYTGDIPVKNLLYGKIFRSTIAHGNVTKIDISEALKVEGVIKILTPDDVPDTKFPTAGHPYSLDPGHKDIEDRSILTKRVRLYGDEICAVIAETELAAKKALKLIKVEYEELPFYLEAEDAIKEGAIEIHEGSKNIIGDTELKIGDVEQGFKDSYLVHEDTYVTQTVQHCHMESQVAYAYRDSDQRWVCVSSTQIPHICRRVLGQAFNRNLSDFRVVKPFIGGGFGNKQDVVIEPLVVAMSMAVGGRPVKLDLTREECLAYTRVRHAISFRIKMGVKEDGLINAVEVEALSNNGAYASHGHSIAVKGGGITASLYNVPNIKYNAKTVYTNTATAGAMRGYGTPQIIFALESHMEEIGKKLGIDPIDIRVKNFLEEGKAHPVSSLTMHTNQIVECIKKGVKEFQWDKKKKDSLNYKTGDKRRGVGVGAFSYATGVYPFSLEIASCRLSLNQDGSVKMMVGATEIGQGSDTVFKQMVAETVGLSYDKIIADAVTDTDYSPFDTGAYASRQTYVTGMAVKKCAVELKDKILHCANKFFDVDETLIDIVDGDIVYTNGGSKICSVADLALSTYYDQKRAGTISAEVSNNFHENNYPMGVTFAEVEVDIKTGKIDILSIMNVHDSGIILNPLLAEGQVEGGMAMGVGYTIGEILRYNPKNGEPYNNNLLDYKMPTIMDTPHLDLAFVEKYDPTAPYGNKGLGEPPLCSPAAAIRNAVYDATDVGINVLPINPQTVFENWTNASKN